MASSQNTSYFSKKITFLNIVLTFLIVLRHATPNLRFGLALDKSTPIIYGLNCLTEVAVPLFFFISGLLFYYNCSKNVIVGKIKRRFKSLVVPYVLWNALFFVVYFILSNWRFTASKMNMTPIPYGFTDIVLSILSSSFTPLWFVKNLIIYTILAPIIFYFISTKTRGILSLFLTFVITLLLDLTYYSPFLWLLIYLQGAILGRFFYRESSNQGVDALVQCFRTKASYFATLCVIGICFTGLYILALWYPDSLLLYRCFTPILLWVITDFLVGQYINTSFKVKAWMGAMFFIYCTHYFVLNIIQKVAVLTFEPTEVFMTLLMIVTPAITIVLLLLVASAISNFKIYKILNGGRGL